MTIKSRKPTTPTKLSQQLNTSTCSPTNKNINRNNHNHNHSQNHNKNSKMTKLQVNESYDGSISKSYS